jgi:hypothetical protein
VVTSGLWCLRAGLELGLAGGKGERGKGRWAEERGKKELGRRERKGVARANEWIFHFSSFLKILNNADFCLFHCEITKAPKIINFFV